MTENVTRVKNELQQLADPKIAEHSQRFFKTGPGEYGEGDVFLGIRVPVLRALSRKYKSISIEEAGQLLLSKFHEERLLALFILVLLYKKQDPAGKEKIYNLYLSNTKYINNWDLVDSSAEHIVGAWLLDKDKSVLYQLCESGDLWERRISIMATFHFIRNKKFDVTLELAEKLLPDQHDLIHKAVGWMLREIGNRDHETECEFLNKHYTSMPRTMLRYAIEKFPKDLYKKYLNGTI